jgi:hypothetical protein
MLFINANFPMLASEELFRYHYENQLKSFPDLQKEFGVSYGMIDFLLDYYKIHRRSISQSYELISKSKYQKTCLAKYGATNALSKNTVPYQKRNNSVMEKYGVINVFQLEDIKDRITETCLRKYGQKRITNGAKISATRQSWSLEKKKEIGQKISISHLNKTNEEISKATEKRIESTRKKYGVDHYTQTAKARLENSKSHKKLWEDKPQEEKISILRRIHDIRESKIELRIHNILAKWNIEYTHSFYLKLRQFDFKIGQTLIEVNGDFYHANPEFYKADDIVPLPCTKGLTAKEIWKKDAMKKTMAAKYKYTVLYLWENEINAMDDEDLEIRLYYMIFGEDYNRNDFNGDGENHETNNDYDN